MSNNMGLFFWDKEAMAEAIDHDELTSLWATGDGPAKIKLLDDLSKEEGFCYIRLFAFICDFARMEMSDFNEMVIQTRSCAGKFPDAREVFTELMSLFFQNFGQLSWHADAEAVKLASKRFNSSKVRIMYSQVGEIAHAEFYSLKPFCECESLICMHGYDYRMFSVSTVHTNKKIGASNFDLGRFLGEGMNVEEEPFEDVYSQLEPEEEQVSSSKSKVQEWKEEKKAQDAEDQTLEDILFEQMKLKEEHQRKKMEQAILKLQQENAKLVEEASLIPSPPTSPQSKHAKSQRTELTIMPHDSSSVISRYGRRFMDEGTVLVPGRSGTEADNLNGRTVLTVQNSLVNGFQVSNEIAENERQSVSRLRPINGLPRPFTNIRLNFLANIHTAITRALERGTDSHVVAMFRVMRVRPELPCDELLYQVLTSTIDRSSNTFASNAFRLPYVEVGMHVTEDAVVKTFELLFLEYKSAWFQEMKNIMVPNFHNQFRGCSTDTMPTDRVRSDRKDRHRPKSDHSKSKKRSPSILGF